MLPILRMLSIVFTATNAVVACHLSQQENLGADYIICEPIAKNSLFFGLDILNRLGLVPLVFDAEMDNCRFADRNSASADPVEIQIWKG